MSVRSAAPRACRHVVSVRRSIFRAVIAVYRRPCVVARVPPRGQICGQTNKPCSHRDTGRRRDHIHGAIPRVGTFWSLLFILGVRPICTATTARCVDTVLTMADATEFQGLVMPQGSERRVLYHSSYRSICTYGCSLQELDQELQDILHSRGALIKEDNRRNMCGRSEFADPHRTQPIAFSLCVCEREREGLLPLHSLLHQPQLTPSCLSRGRPFCVRAAVDVVTSSNTLVHMLMDRCGSSSFVQLKMWTDF